MRGIGEKGMEGISTQHMAICVVCSFIYPEDQFAQIWIGANHLEGCCHECSLKEETNI